MNWLKRKKTSTRILLFTAILMTFGVATLVAFLTLHELTLEAAASGWRRFIVSPGMGGLAAVVAASIAAVAVGRQLRHARMIESRKAWWQTFEWVTDRVLPMKDKPTFDKSWGMTLLAELESENIADSSHEKARASTAKFLIEEMRKEEERLSSKVEEAAAPEAAPTEGAGLPSQAVAPHPGKPNGREAFPGAISIQALEALRTKNLEAVSLYNARTRGTEGSTAFAEAYEFEGRVGLLIAQIASSPQWDFSTLNPVQDGMEFDAFFRKNGVSVVIETTAVHSRNHLVHKIRKTESKSELFNAGLVIATTLPHHVIKDIPHGKYTRVVSLPEFGSGARNELEFAIREVWQEKSMSFGREATRGR